jgi:hypothetical protein
MRGPSILHLPACEWGVFHINETYISEVPTRESLRNLELYFSAPESFYPALAELDRSTRHLHQYKPVSRSYLRLWQPLVGRRSTAHPHVSSQNWPGYAVWVAFHLCSTHENQFNKEPSAHPPQLRLLFAPAHITDSPISTQVLSTPASNGDPSIVQKVRQQTAFVPQARRALPGWQLRGRGMVSIPLS